MARSWAGSRRQDFWTERGSLSKEADFKYFPETQRKKECVERHRLGIVRVNLYKLAKSLEASVLL